jgi:hypothetical protein
MPGLLLCSFCDFFTIFYDFIWSFVAQFKLLYILDIYLLQLHKVCRSSGGKCVWEQWGHGQHRRAGNAPVTGSRCALAQPRHG